MKIQIISVGKKHDKNFTDVIAEYEKRLGKGFVSWVFITHSDKEKESKEILKSLKDKPFILLDEKGKNISTKDIAEFFDKNKMEGNRDIVFVIGGAYGVSEEVKKSATYIWSLGGLIFPHMLVRVILVEQLYRAFSIINGGKYHHE